MWETFAHCSSALCLALCGLLDDFLRRLFSGSSMNCAGFGAGSRRTRTRSIGMEAAMMEVAGSAVPKMKRSTVVAVQV